MSSLGLQGVFAIRFGKETMNPMPIVRFDHVESIYDGSRWKLVLEHPSWSFWSKFVDGESKSIPPFDYKFGIEGATEKGAGGQLTDWHRGVILKADQSMSLFDARATIIGSGPSLQMKSITRTKCWVGSFRAIVSKIATEHGLIPDVASADETDNPGVRMFRQYGENDWEFVKRIADKQITASTSRRGDYEVWTTRGRTLHVRPPGDERRAKKVWQTGALGVGMKRMRFVQRKRALQMQGGLAVQGVGYDFLGKKPLTSIKNYNNFPENTRLAPRVSLPSASDVPAVTFRSTADTQVKLDKQVTAFLGKRFRRMYLAEIDIFPEFAKYEVGDVIQIVVNQPNSPGEQTFSGNYLLEQRITRILGRNIKMRLLASRVGSQQGDQPIEGRQMDDPAIELPDGRIREITRLA